MEHLSSTIDANAGGATVATGEYSRDREVDLSQLFSDVSRTVGSLRNIIQTNAQQQAQADPSGFGGSGGNSGGSSTVEKLSSVFESAMGSKDEPSALAKLFGGGSGVCFKTCGMEDIQFAARRAGEMFMTAKTCMIVLTFVVTLCIILGTCIFVFFLYKNWHRWTAFDSDNRRDGTAASPFFFSRRPPPTLTPPNGLHKNNHNQHSPASVLSSTD
uniref:Uncharacterized protein n=1 Tax=Panagrellus redivivus TaxID=6233 RepID=A0A7E4V207_PANRE